MACRMAEITGAGLAGLTLATYLYGFALGHCPDPLTVLRAMTLRQVSRSPWLDRNLNRGARFEPMGAASPATPR